MVAALFAWHPIHVESVAWIAARKDVLSSFFALLSLLSYVRFARENRRRYFWFALSFFALGLLAKPMIVTLPFVFCCWISGHSDEWRLVGRATEFLRELNLTM